MRAFLKPITAAVSLAIAGTAIAEPSFVPIYRDNFPDPHIIRHNGTFVAYATN